MESNQNHLKSQNLKKRYKLIKSYPGSLPLNTIVEFDDKCQIPNYKVSRDGCAYLFYRLNIIEDNSEFWKEEIFTIGDKIEGGIINHFFIEEDKIYVRVDTGVDGYWHTLELKYLKKAKTKLFTTEDGIDIFEGDEFYRFSDLSSNSIQIFEESRTGFYNSYPWMKYFSTKEKAEEYILYNKPCLSYNDILSLCMFTEEQLKQLVKKKLNL